MERNSTIAAGRRPRKNILRVEPLNRGCSRSAGVPACEFTGRPAPCSFARRDAARTRSRDGCVTRFMGSLHDSGIAHRDLEPTPDPSQEGNCRRASAVLLPSWEGSGVGRFMGRIAAIKRLALGLAIHSLTAKYKRE